MSKANQQIEMNNEEMKRLKEASMMRRGLESSSFDDGDFDDIDNGEMKEIVEQFEVNSYIYYPKTCCLGLCFCFTEQSTKILAFEERNLERNYCY